MKLQKTMSLRNIISSLRQLNPVVGLLLIVIGVVMLAISFVAHLTHLNFIQILAFILIIGGVISHVMLQKWQSRY